MKPFTPRVVLVLLAAIAALSLTSVLFASKFVTLVWEAEDVTLTAKNITFKIMKCIEDPGGKVSGNKVLAVPKVPPGEKVKYDEVTYKVAVPADGVYYLWARTYWANGCGNAFEVKVQGYDTGKDAWVIGKDGTYDALHWVALTDDSKDPRPLRLHKGDVALTLGAKESGSRVDEFMLTTDKEKRPAGVYKPTPGALDKK